MHAFETTLDRPMAEAEHAVRDALAAEGFGVLTEVDVAATLEQKLGVHRPPLKILGACNPSLANRSLELDPSMSLVLPCNVVLDGRDDGRTRVAIVDPRDMVAGSELGPDTPAGHDLASLGEEAARKLQAVLDHLGG